MQIYLKYHEQVCRTAYLGIWKQSSDVVGEGFFFLFFSFFIFY